MTKKVTSKSRQRKLVLKSIQDWPEEERRLGELNPAPYNPRVDDQPEALDASMKQFGVLQPIVINRRNNVIIGGHKRFNQLKVEAETEYGDRWEQVVVRVRVADLNSADERVANLALNKIGSDPGMWDDVKLQDVFKDALLVDYDLSVSGFDTDDIDQFRSDDNGETTESTQREVEVLAPVTQDQIPDYDQSTTTTAIGDLWELGKHRLICGDAEKSAYLAALLDGAKAHMVLTDPPYNVQYEGGRATSGDFNRGKQWGKSGRAYTDKFEDYEAWLHAVLSLTHKVTHKKAALMMFFAMGQAEEVFAALRKSNWIRRSTIIWNKVNARYGALGSQYKHRYEPIAYAHKKGSAPYWYGRTDVRNLLDVPTGQAYEDHPTPKPLDILAPLVPNHTRKGDIVLDMFAGSGSTLMVCEQLGRVSYNLEIDPSYCDVIVKRWESHTGKKAKRIPEYVTWAEEDETESVAETEETVDAST